MKVSAVVSIYNIEKYLHDCVDSLIGQTLKDIEIILVDDGATDSSPRIVDDYSSRYDNVVAVHKANGGLSSARNEGMKYATGEYIIFVDGDDWLEKTALAEMYNNAKQNRTDMTMCCFYRSRDNRNIPSREMKVVKMFQQDTVYDTQRDIFENVLFHMIGTDPEAELDVDVHMSVWRCLYRRTVLMEHGCQFKSEREYISEDIIFHLDTFPFINRLSTVAKPLYYYRENDQSLTKKYKPDRFEKECFLYSAVMEKIQQNQFSSQVTLREQRSFIGRARGCIIAEVRDNTKADFIEKVKNIRRILNNAQLQEVLRSFPIQRLNAKLRLLALCMRYKLAVTLLVIVAVKDTRK